MIDDLYLSPTNKNSPTSHEVGLLCFDGSASFPLRKGYVM